MNKKICSLSFVVILFCSLLLGSANIAEGDIAILTDDGMGTSTLSPDLGLTITGAITGFAKFNEFIVKRADEVYVVIFLNEILGLMDTVVIPEFDIEGVEGEGKIGMPGRVETITGEVPMIIELDVEWNANPGVETAGFAPTNTQQIEFFVPEFPTGTAVPLAVLLGIGTFWLRRITH